LCAQQTRPYPTQGDQSLVLPIAAIGHVDLTSYLAGRWNPMVNGKQLQPCIRF
jgi:hypothetical protein